MVLSLFTSNSERMGKYRRVSNANSENESETGQSNNDSEHRYSENYRDDDLPLLPRYDDIEKSDIRAPRRSKRLTALILGIVVGSVFFSLILSNHAKSRRKRTLTKWDNQYLPENRIEEIKPECSMNCMPYSALPDWPLAVKSHDSFTGPAMDRWIGKGQVYDVANKADMVDFSNYTRLDGITFWVNGTDPRHQAARDHYAQNKTDMDYRPQSSNHSNKSTTLQLAKRSNKILNVIQGLQNDDKRFREQNELLYSLRSAKESLQDHLRTMHIISTDYWDNGLNHQDGIQDRLFEGRRGQLPYWLDTDSTLVAFGNQSDVTRAEIRFHHDWETFAPMVKTIEDLEQWKMKRLPSFNSIAAEAVLGVNLPDLGENAFLSSDDMFLGQKMTTADFVTPLYGPVLHFDMHIIMKPSKDPWALGEMAGLRYSVSLLQKRFGTRRFPYPSHVHKSLSKALLMESRMMWKEEFEMASAERFRGNGLMANSHLLSYGLIIERHREALLWSFLVNKLDIDGNGKLDVEEIKRAHKLMGTDGTSDITGRMRKRTTIRPESINESLVRASFPRPETSKYIFSSMDGYSLSEPSSNFTEITGITSRNGVPRFWPLTKESTEQKQRFKTNYCSVPIKTCWPELKNDEMMTANKVFTRFAFQEPSCGDCLIMHLIDQSGSAGLEAFLPSDNHTLLLAQDEFAPQTTNKVPLSVPAHLPLHTDWEKIDFSLSSISKTNHNQWKRRDFSIHLIQRYNYVVAKASTNFEQISNPSSARRIFNKLMRSQPAFICLNDDVRWQLDKVRLLMLSFFESMWPTSSTRLPFEKL